MGFLSVPIHRTRILLAIVALSFIVVGLFTDASADTVYTDTFDGSPNYSTIQFNAADSGVNPDDISFASATASTNGNPGADWEIGHEHDVERDMGGDPLNGDGFTNLQSAYVNQTFCYNPSVDGPIVDVMFSLDYQISNPAVDSVFFGISDPVGGQFLGFASTVASGNWESINSTAFTQADASSIDFSGSQDIKFAFGFTSQLDVSGGSEFIVFNVDNFSVSVTTVPEPGSALILACLTGLTLRRRKRR